MSRLFITGIGGILLSGVFATVLMIANVDAHDDRADACTFASGYGIGDRACSDSLSMASQAAAETRLAYRLTTTGSDDRN